MASRWPQMASGVSRRYLTRAPTAKSVARLRASFSRSDLTRGDAPGAAVAGSRDEEESRGPAEADALAKVDNRFCMVDRDWMTSSQRVAMARIWSVHAMTSE